MKLPLAASLALDRRKAAWAVGLGVASAAVAAALVPEDLRLAGVVLSLALAWASVVDADRFILPDVLTLALVLLGAGLAAVQGYDALLGSTLGAAAGYLSLAVVAFGYRMWRGREGLGRGDAKLFAAAGAWLGWADLPLVMLIASGAAILWVLLQVLRKGSVSATMRLPFGPFIAGGFWAVWLIDAV